MQSNVRDVYGRAVCFGVGAVNCVGALDAGAVEAGGVSGRMRERVCERAVACNEVAKCLPE